MVNYLNIFYKKNYVRVLFLILLLGIIIRFINLPGNINFHFDQGRDALRIYNMIFEGDLKLVGPETDIPGVFNGPIFYYLLTPLYLFGSFNPDFVAGSFILLNVAGGYLCFLITKILFKNVKIGLISALLWIISYEQGVFARYISNASLMSLSSMLFFLGLSMKLFTKSKVGLIISATGYGLAIHANFYLIYLGIFYILIYFAYKPKLSFQEIKYSILALIFLISPFIITEIKWGFPATKALLSYFTEQSDNAFNLISHLKLYIEKMNEMIYYSLIAIPSNFLFLAPLLLIVYIFKREHNRKQYLFLLIWFFSNAPLFIFRSGVLTVPVINSTIFGAITLLFALGIYHLHSLNKLKFLSFFLFVIIFVSNSYLYVKSNFKPYDLLSAIPSVLVDARSVIDYTYKNSEGKDFSICAITNPLFTNTTLSFLYLTYGKPKYDYVPYWSGQKQYLLEGKLKYDTKKIEKRYLIIEPPVGVPIEAVQASIYMEDQVSKVVDEKKFGNYVVQKRIFLKENEHMIDSQNLSEREISLVQGRIDVDPRYSCFNDY
jgi:hypothetical protein